MTEGRRRRTGLTLIELVVSLTIGAMAVSMGYAALTLLIDRRDDAERATRGTMRAWALRETLSEWLAGARLGALGSAATFRGLGGQRAGLADDELTFLTSARTQVSDGGTLIRLFVARDKAGRTLGLAADFTEWPGTRHEMVTLDSTVAGLEITYRSSVFETPKWLTSWVSNTVLPNGVRLALFPAPHDSLAQLLRAPVLVALEGGR